MTKQKRITKIVCLALLFLIGGQILLSAFSVRAGAVFSKETSVLEDLESDPNFDKNLYTEDNEDFSLKVFQLAEGESGDVYIYVYQPSASQVNMTASAVNISNTGTAVGLRKCNLELIDKEGVFHKYRVQGLQRLNDFVRKYFIVCLYRPWNEGLGDSTSDVGTIGVEKAVPVETVWTATTNQNGEVSYSAEYSEDTITVTSEVLGNIYYADNYASPVAWSSESGLDSHYLAFSTNKPVDHLKKVYIEYDYYRDYQSGTYREEVNDTCEVVLTDTEVFEGVMSNSVFYDKYSYQRIQDVATFLAEEGSILTDSAREAIAAQNWILRYDETLYVNSYNPTTMEFTLIYTEIKAVTMFRMEYIYNDMYYDVGVIADVLTEDDINDGYVEAQEWWQKIMAVLAIILICVLIKLFWGPIKFFFNLLWTGIKVLISAVLQIIAIPFKILKSLFQ